MRSDDKFFDAFVREKLRQSDAGVPVHLWDRIRYETRRYYIKERNKYVLLILLLLLSTGSIGYWAFHNMPQDELNARLHRDPKAIAESTGRVVLRNGQVVVPVMQKGTATGQGGASSAADGTSPTSGLPAAAPVLAASSKVTSPTSIVTSNSVSSSFSSIRPASPASSSGAVPALPATFMRPSSGRSSSVVKTVGRNWGEPSNGRLSSSGKSSDGGVAMDRVSGCSDGRLTSSVSQPAIGLASVAHLIYADTREGKEQRSAIEGNMTEAEAALPIDNGAIVVGNGLAVRQENVPAATYSKVTARILDAYNDAYSPAMVSNGGGLYTGPEYHLPELQRSSVISIALRPLKRRAYLEFYASPDNVFRKFKDNNNSYGKYISKRQSVERSYLSFSAGMLMAVPVFNRWWLKSGVNYSQINERLHYVNNNYQTSVSVITSRTVVRGVGDTVRISDTTQVATTGKHVKQSLNTYRMLDIPVILGYEFGMGEKIKVNVNAGGIINLHSWYSGIILDTTYAPVVISSAKTAGVSAWKTNLGVALYGSVALSTALNDRTEVSLEPYIRYYLKPVNKDASVLTQQYRTTGLIFGIRYQLGKRRFAK